MLVECIANVRMKRHSKIGSLCQPLTSKFWKYWLCQGDRIIVVIKKARTSESSDAAAAAAAAAGAGPRVKRGDVRHAVVVRTRKHMQRKDGMVVRFDDNACALIGNNGEPLGTRINSELVLVMLKSPLEQYIWKHKVDVEGWLSDRRRRVGASRQTVVENLVASSSARMIDRFGYLWKQFSNLTEQLEPSCWRHMYDPMYTVLLSMPSSLHGKLPQQPKPPFTPNSLLITEPCYLLENIATAAANIEEFLRPRVNHGSSRFHEKRVRLTMPVSAERCCDWKNTASLWWQFGHCLFDLGSYNIKPCQPEIHWLLPSPDFSFHDIAL